MKKKKARPGDLRQQMNRVRNSRDNLKNINREKAVMNKKLRDRNVELTESRDQWKTRSKELDRQLQTAQEEAERERMRADRELERADRLQAEIEALWGKKSRA
jgi:predicted nuclease with TOPRIM domain